jgi:hypothetical protein
MLFFRKFELKGFQKMYREKDCLHCSVKFLPASPSQKYCLTCRDIVSKEKARLRDLNKSRRINNYTKYTKKCKFCAMAFETYYTKKITCGSAVCEKKRIQLKNYNTHLKRDKSSLNEKGTNYYHKHRDSILTHKAQKYRETTGSDSEYLTGKTIKLTFNYVKSYIENRKYRLLSTTYTNSSSKLILECPEGHRWTTTFKSFSDKGDIVGSRCLHCYLKNNYTSRLELEVRDFTQKEFPDIPVLYNVRNIINPKELDLYFPDHNLAIEVCGLFWHSDTANGTPKDYH